MRRLGLLFVMILTAGAGFAQVSAGGGGTVVLPPIAVSPISVSLGNTNSVIDQSGNVLLFDSVLTGFSPASALATPTPTHVSVISSDGRTVNGYSYSGSFQILGVGHNAVYALVGSVSGGNGSPFIITRTLVALRVVAGTLPATLPSITVPLNQDVKLSAGTGSGESDRIALISGVSAVVLTPATAAGVNNPHMILLYACDGATFTPNPNNPIMTNSH
ncbi:MAG TPA: hypothetical protein VGK48_27355 [Terriglobia bacterium]|jgi:hypothetical protein